MMLRFSSSTICLALLMVASFPAEAMMWSPMVVVGEDGVQKRSLGLDDNTPNLPFFFGDKKGSGFDWLLRGQMKRADDQGAALRPLFAADAGKKKRNNFDYIIRPMY